MSLKSTWRGLRLNLLVFNVHTGTIRVFSCGKDFKDVHVFLVSVVPESAITTVHRSLHEENFLGEHGPWKVV